MSMTYVVPDKVKQPFKKGQLVDTMNRKGGVMETVKIVRAGPRVVRTECGRTWRAKDGWWIGENGTWPFPWIRHHK